MTFASPGSPTGPGPRPRSSTTTSRPARSCSSRRCCTRSRPRATSASPGRRGGVDRDRGLARAIERCLPLPGSQERDWTLWVELWLRAVRDPQMRPLAADLYSRYREWIESLIAAGVESGEWAPKREPEQIAELAIARDRRARGAGPDPGPGRRDRSRPVAGRRAARRRARDRGRGPCHGGARTVDFLNRGSV